MWRLYGLYWTLNYITRPFKFPCRNCEYAVLDISKSKQRISFDMDSVYWQVLVHQESHSKMVFLV